MPKKVLLVDDSTTTLMMEEMILKQRTAYECVTAKDGLDAIARAVVEAPDLVLMDVVMPRMNGFEACKRMRLESSLRETPGPCLTAGIRSPLTGRKSTPSRSPHRSAT